MYSVSGPATPVLGAFGLPLVVTETPIPKVQLSFPYNINTALAIPVTANGGTVTQADSKAVLQTSANPAGSAILQSRDAARYTPGQGQACKFTGIFAPGVVNSQQEIGIGDLLDGFFFGFVGATFGIIRRRGGVDNFIPQASWNGRTPSSFTPITNGQVYVIRYQFLGHGDIYFYIEDAGSGLPVLVHVIKYAGSDSLPSIFNPSLPVWLRVVNQGNATNLTLQSASAGVFAEGPINRSGARAATGNRKTGIVAETSIFTLRNNSTVFGGPANNNRARIHLDFISSAMSGGADSQIRGVLNATLGGVPVFNDIATNTSVCSVDVAGTTVTGGRELFRLTSTGNAQAYQDVDSLDILLIPGDTFTFSGQSFGGGVAFNGGVGWTEEI